MKKVFESFKDSYSESINEKLFQEQIPWSLKLKPGDVIYATEDYTEKDIDFARMSKSRIGKITRLNMLNMSKGGTTYTTPWVTAKRGDLIAIVFGNGKIITLGGYVANIKDIGKEDHLLYGLNILLADDKIEIKKYNPNNKKERIHVFDYNLYAEDKTGSFEYKDLEIPINNIKKMRNFDYDHIDDILIFDEVYNSDGERVASLRLKNASNDKNLTYNGKYLFEI